MSLVNGSLSDRALIECRLLVAANELDRSCVIRLDETPAYGDSEDVALQGVASNFAGGTIAAKCREHAESASDSDTVWAQNSKLTALKVSTLDEQR